MLNERPTTRCEWADSDPLMQMYHDHEWGVPTRDSAVAHRAAGLWAIFFIKVGSGFGKHRHMANSPKPLINLLYPTSA